MLNKDLQQILNDRDTIRNKTGVLIPDSFQNFKLYNLPKAQLVIADIPYNLGNYAYASNPMWYVDGDNKKGESDKAGKCFFNGDENFNIVEFFNFCNKLIIPEPKNRNAAGCMFVFCAFQQQFFLIETAKKYGFKNYIPMQFYKNFSSQVLKANMKVVGNTEYGLLFYREKLPKFRGGGNMVFNCVPYPVDNTSLKIHPTQKSKDLIKFLIRLFTDEGDVVIDPCAGSGITLIAAQELRRKTFGFEIKKNFVLDYYNKLNKNLEMSFF